MEKAIADIKSDNSILNGHEVNHTIFETDGLNRFGVVQTSKFTATSFLLHSEIVPHPEHSHIKATANIHLQLTIGLVKP